MAYHNQKGSNAERELVNLFDYTPFAVMRAPASGAATERELPDVLAGNGEDFYAVEAKSSSKNVVYLTAKEIAELQYFGKNFGATPLVGVRFNIKHGDPAYENNENPGWYFFHIEDLYVTPGGNYRVKKETALESGIDFSELTGHSVDLEDMNSNDGEENGTEDNEAAA